MAVIARRALIKESPAVIGAPTLAIAEEPPSEIVRLFQERCHHRDACNSVVAQRLPADEGERLAQHHCDMMMEAEDAMLEIPTGSISDLAAKVLAHTDDGENWLTNTSGGLRLLAELGALLGVEVPTERG